MKREHLIVALLVVLATSAGACCKKGCEESDVSVAKIPITTASEGARAAFLEGRELAENLRGTDARQRYLQAVAEDQTMAWAHLGLANTAPTNADFFAALERAEECAPGASEGERLLIEAFSAGVNGKPERQLELLQALVTAYPEDERAQNQLGLFYFARQEWPRAVEHLSKATDINPDFVPAYNQLGYARRFQGDVAGAEATFQKYIELLPNEANPYDSYAELLMKTGRFDESIAQYRKALEVNPNFVASYVGIGNNHIFKGEPAAAREAFAELAAAARTDGERRQACTWAAFSYLHEDDHERALEEIERRYEIAAETDDFGAMAGDLNVVGDILLDAGRAGEALAKYEESVAMSATSNATAEAKEAVRRNHLADLVRVALASGDVEKAREHAEQYSRQVEVRGIAFEVWQTHELRGLIALEEGDFQAAAAAFEQANQQDARVMLAHARALDGAGDAEAASELYLRAAQFNTLNQAPQNFAFVRPEALEKVGTSPPGV